jgi:hypothetical protein
VVRLTWNRSAARAVGQPCSTITRASRSRPSSVKGALRWGTRISWVGVGAWQLHTRPGGPPQIKSSPTYPAPTCPGSTTSPGGPDGSEPTAGRTDQGDAAARRTYRPPPRWAARERWGYRAAGEARSQRRRRGPASRTLSASVRRPCRTSRQLAVAVTLSLAPYFPHERMDWRPAQRGFARTHYFAPDGRQRPGKMPVCTALSP